LTAVTSCSATAAGWAADRVYVAATPALLLLLLPLVSGVVSMRLPAGFASEYVAEMLFAGRPVAAATAATDLLAMLALNSGSVNPAVQQHIPCTTEQHTTYNVPSCSGLQASLYFYNLPCSVATLVLNFVLLRQ
jgi:hypothetical protein